MRGFENGSYDSSPASPASASTDGAVSVREAPPEVLAGVDSGARVSAPLRATRDHINMMGIVENMMSGILMAGALEPECEILMFMWSVSLPFAWLPIIIVRILWVAY